MGGRLIAAVAAVLVLAGCGDGGSGAATDSPATDSPTDSPSESTTATPTESETASPRESKTARPTEPRPRGSRIVAADSDFGTVLFDGKDQAIYLFDVENTARPKCYGACAEAWPPVLTDGEPVAGPGIQASRLGTTERSDGTTQVTYGGHPLYLYAHEGPGEVKCHDVFLNGGNWYAVQPDGERAP